MQHIFVRSPINARSAKWALGVAVLVVLVAAMAVPFGLSLVALAPFGLAAILAAAVYSGWRHRQAPVVHDDTRRARVVHVGGTEEPNAQPKRGE
jgi:hypothetical protein